MQKNAPPLTHFRPKVGPDEPSQSHGKSTVLNRCRPRRFSSCWTAQTYRRSSLILLAGAPDLDRGLPVRPFLPHLSHLDGQPLVRPERGSDSQCQPAQVTRLGTYRQILTRVQDGLRTRAFTSQPHACLHLGDRDQKLGPESPSTDEVLQRLAVPFILTVTSDQGLVGHGSAPA